MIDEKESLLVTQKGLELSIVSQFEGLEFVLFKNSIETQSLKQVDRRSERSWIRLNLVDVDFALESHSTKLFEALILEHHADTLK